MLIFSVTVCQSPSCNFPLERSTIFISSVSDGLAPYRRPVAEIVRGNGYRTEMQDEFEVRGDQVETMVREKIRASQGVICLLGPSYGQLSPMQVGDYHLSYSQTEWVMLKPGVKVQTIHAAKGLQYRAVIVLWAGGIPYVASQNQDDVAAERRLFYVGLTRAEDILTLTASSSDWSPFITEVESTLAAKRLRPTGGPS